MIKQKNIPPFKRGDTVVLDSFLYKGKAVTVNGQYKKNGEWYALVDTYLWHTKDAISQSCTTVRCSSLTKVTYD